MITNFKRAMRVQHTVEVLENVPHHVVKIYAPSGYEYASARWPVTEVDTSLAAIWSGVDEASKYVDLVGASGLAVYSTDKEAFDAYCAEVDAL